MTHTFTRDFDTPVFKGKVSVNTGLLIGGEWIDSVDKQTIEFVPFCTFALSNSPTAHSQYIQSWYVVVCSFAFASLIKLL